MATKDSRTVVRTTVPKKGENIVDALLNETVPGMERCDGCGEPTPPEEIQRSGGRKLCTGCQPIS